MPLVPLIEGIGKWREHPIQWWYERFISWKNLGDSCTDHTIGVSYYYSNARVPVIHWSCTIYVNFENTRWRSNPPCLVWNHLPEGWKKWHLSYLRGRVVCWLMNNLVSVKPDRPGWLLLYLIYPCMHPFVTKSGRREITNTKIRASVHCSSSFSDFASMFLNNLIVTLRRGSWNLNIFVENTKCQLSYKALNPFLFHCE